MAAALAILETEGIAGIQLLQPWVKRQLVAMRAAAELGRAVRLGGALPAIILVREVVAPHLRVGL